MELIQKAKIEKLLDYAEEHFGEWKIVIQKNSDGKIRCHTQFATDIDELSTGIHLTFIQKRSIMAED
ncbi:MAG TPA: hypothetical protein VK469_20585 [Candidatus Kapabacteria bacterium]|nr:hypothetical protein [Candidatus Kapabacteria bacterium]